MIFFESIRPTLRFNTKHSERPLKKEGGQQRIMEARRILPYRTASVIHQ